MLDVRDRLREQRVKQLASRLIEAALGLGRVKPAKNGKAKKRPKCNVDRPCHAVVIESLEHYRPDELRTRRENRQLMQWSSAKVKRLLEEGCKLHGLYLREVAPNYTSRQCSRTGWPGLRCDDVPEDEFLTAFWWQSKVAASRKKIANGQKTVTDQFLVDLADRLSQRAHKTHGANATVRIPRLGGDLFVAALPRNAGRKGGRRGERGALQADLNAAANIGLRALLDPDWPGRWWYVPCKARSLEPVAERVKGSAVFASGKPLPTGDKASAGGGSTRAAAKGRGGKTAARAREIVNLWRDPAVLEVADPKAGYWRPTPAYWNDVTARVIALLRRRAGLG